MLTDAFWKYLKSQHGYSESHEERTRPAVRVISFNRVDQATRLELASRTKGDVIVEYYHCFIAN